MATTPSSTEPFDGFYTTPRGRRISADSVSWVATRSGGPGGQHANTSDTAVTVTIDVARAGLPEVIRLRIEAAAGNVIDSYLHVQGGRGVNGVLIEMSGATQELAHDVAVHIAFARPRFLGKDDVPADVVAAERATLETLTRNEGKPEAAIGKIVDGRIQGFLKDVALLEQPYAKDDKLSVAKLIGSAKIVRYAQVHIG